MHSHLVHPFSTGTVALERIAYLPRLPGQEDEGVRVKIQERACWIVQPGPDRDTGGGFDGEILRGVGVREGDARVDQLRFGEREGMEKILVVKGSGLIGVGKLALSADFHVEDRVIKVYIEVVDVSS